jgi:uncharacterized membrane protein
MNRHIAWALVISSLTSIGFFVVGAIDSHSGQYWYLVWNLILAWLPLLFAVWLVRLLPRYSWSGWQGVILTLVWLGFLPNSFYISSDLIHLANLGAPNLLYNAVMFMSFAFNGLALGFISLYLIHVELLKRLSIRGTHVTVALILLLCSFAIYLGRDLRWNTWSVITSPFGVLFDITDRFVNPRAHPETFTTTLAFFVLLGSMYIVIWNVAQALSTSHYARKKIPD